MCTSEEETVRKRGQESVTKREIERGCEIATLREREREREKHLERKRLREI